MKVPALLCALSIPSLIFAQSPPEIWEDPVLPQPFEKQPFRPVRVADWVWETAGAGYTLSGMDTARREQAAQAGVTLSELGFVDPFYAYPYQRVLLRSAIDWAAAAPAPISVEAPMCVHAVSMRQKKVGQRLVVALFNDINTTAHHAAPGDDVPLREEVLPIHDIRVTFHGYKLGRIHLEPGSIDLPKTDANGSATVTVPRLDVQALVVAELE